MRRFVFSVFLAAACAGVLGTRVYVDFERIRLRVIDAPVQSGDSRLAVPLPDATPLAASPSAIIARIRGGASTTRLVMAVNDAQIARLTIPARREIRVDASAQLPAGSGHELVLMGNGSGWELAYLELANVHGFSRGLVDFVIVPRERPRERGISPWLLVPILFGLVALRPRWDWPPGRAGRMLYRMAATGVLLFFAAAVLAELFTRYRILVSLQTFLLCAAILYAEPIARLRRPAEPHVRRTLRWILAWIRQWGPLVPYVAIPALLLWCVGQFYRPEVGFTPLIVFGEEFSSTAHPVLRRTPHAVEPGPGYDGQFYAQLALDPLLRGQPIIHALDSPGYRARRILFPWAAYLLGLGRSWYVLQAYALLNVASWLGLAWLLVRWLPPRTIRSTFAWSACLLTEGLLASVRQSLVDGPSMLLLAVCVVALEQNRRALAAAILGIAGLGRDTNLFGGLALLDKAPARSSLLSLVPQGLLLVAPLALWMLYLSGLNLSPGETGYANFGLPFGAYARKWSVTLGELRLYGWDSFARFSFLSLVALTTQALVLAYNHDWRDPWWRLGIAYAGLMLVLGDAVWDGYPGAATRVVLPMTFAFNILLPRVRWFWPLWVLGNANMIVGLSAIRVPWLWYHL